MDRRQPEPRTDQRLVDRLVGLADRSLTSALALLLVAGCHGHGPKNAQSVDPDANSGADAKRTGALHMPVNQPVSDEVNFDHQDETDWKVLELTGSPGVLELELHWDAPEANLNVDIYDGLGEQIAASPSGSTDRTKKVAAEVERPGTYFVRVQAPGAKNGSVYSVIAHWGEKSVPPPPPLATAEPRIDKPRPAHHGAHPPKPPRTVDVNGLQGRVVSSYREGGSLILHLDKGSAAHVEVGQTGTVLDGPTGATPLDGGTFTIIQVIDDTRSIAKTSLRSLGRNIRVSISTSR
jgi:hypothetical protein